MIIFPKNSYRKKLLKKYEKKAVFDPNSPTPASYVLASKTISTFQGTSSPGMQSPGPPNFNLGMNSDVMVVGEPSLMGGEFGFEDER